MKKTPKEIIVKLMKDTVKNKIKWKVSIRENYIKSVHILHLTPKKSLIFKLTYYLNNSQLNRLNIVLAVEKNENHDFISITEIGNSKKESKLIATLTNTILNNEEGRENYLL